MLSTLSLFRTSPAAKPSTIALAWRTLSSVAGGTNYDVVVIGPCDTVVVVAPACVKSDDYYFIYSIDSLMYCFHHFLLLHGCCYYYLLVV